MFDVVCVVLILCYIFELLMSQVEACQRLKARPNHD